MTRTLAKVIDLTKEDVEDLRNGYAVLRTTDETLLEHDIIITVRD